MQREEERGQQERKRETLRERGEREREREEGSSSTYDSLTDHECDREGKEQDFDDNSPPIILNSKIIRGVEWD